MWLWELYGKVINYMNWVYGQLDNSYNVEYCFFLDRYFYYKWKDNDCYEVFYYICEDL